MTKPEQPRLSPEEWMRRWEQAPNEQRLAMVATLLTAARGAEQCLYGGHDELQTRLEATQRRVTDLDGQLQRAKEALRRAKESLDRVRDAHRDTCLLTTGQASPPAFTCSMCDALTVPTPSADGSESPAGPGWDDHLHRLERRLAELENKVARLSPDEPAPGLGDRLDRANRRITDLTARLNHAEDTLSRARALHAATCPRATGTQTGHHPCDLCGLLGVSAPAGEGTR